MPDLVIFSTKKWNDGKKPYLAGSLSLTNQRPVGSLNLRRQGNFGDARSGPFVAQL
jgi:hypothetical protein